MDRLELRRVTCYPGVNASDIVILVGSFSATGFRAAEAVLSNHKVRCLLMSLSFEFLEWQIDMLVS